MCRPLSEIDKVYGALGKHISPAERLKYCISLIEKTEEYLRNNHSKLTPLIKSRSAEMIRAAQKEIIDLAQSGAPAGPAGRRGQRGGPGKARP